MHSIQPHGIDPIIPSTARECHNPPSGDSQHRELLQWGLPLCPHGDQSQTKTKAPDVSGPTGSHCPFPHHYQGRIDFNTVNPCHSTGMDLVSIPAGRVVLANPVPRAKIFQSSPQRQDFPMLSLQRVEQPSSRDEHVVDSSMLVRHHAVQVFCRQAKVVTLVIAFLILTKTIHRFRSNYV